MSNAENPVESISRVRAAVMSDLRQGTAGDPLGRVGQACIDLLPVDGVSISMISGTQHRETLYASDEISAHIETLQFSLGEGPCFEAFHTRRPVLVPDLGAATAVSWPVFATEIAGQLVGAIFAFPMQSGAIRIGALDLYRHRPGWLTRVEVSTALQVVDIAMLALLGLQVDPAEGEWVLSLPRDREQVHQATGMLIGAFGISPEQALARLRAYAFATGRMVEDLADDIVTRRLSPEDLDT
ncbi:GAF and ANTAR domain-containing protein [Qaidamihabitans albus]|uniref:GAF and ANTAR domain-containing protein n=1 Tax=Qaidamihabitans albus TaxID=2795733 RepID=UPI001F23ED97|nr:GAF and ANTAR domain-containing protein [Qaidamihabitans albus]